MPLRKTAIAVPDDLLAAVDRAARARHESRNRFVTLVLRHAVRARRDAEITRRLNEFFATPDLARQHTTAALQHAEPRASKAGCRTAGLSGPALTPAAQPDRWTTTQ
jgi:metal-responsive CopG/Arc/MetJ family transcriptional regulator